MLPKVALPLKHPGEYFWVIFLQFIWIHLNKQSIVGGGGVRRCGWSLDPRKITQGFLSSLNAIVCAESIETNQEFFTTA